MTFLQPSWLLAGTLGLLLMLVPVSKAQQTNSQSRSGQDPATASPGTGQEFPLYQRGYRQGMEDRNHGREADPGYVSWQNSAGETAYRSGYQAGYCHDERQATGYYNGIYRSYAPPMVRNGYYGYNAPDPYCESKSAKPISYRRGEPSAPQNRVEYGGGG